MRHYEAKESYAWCFQRIKCYITSVLQHQNRAITLFVLHLLMFFCCVQNMKTRWYWMWKHWSTNLCRTLLSFTPCSTNSLEQILLLKHYLTGRNADRIWAIKHSSDHSQIHDSQHVWPTQFRYHTTNAKCDNLIKKLQLGIFEKTVNTVISLRSVNKTIFGSAACLLVWPSHSLTASGLKTLPVCSWVSCD